MPNPRIQDERIEALYAQLPKIECQGLCSDSCGPISMSVRERARIQRAAGKDVTCGERASCSMLTEDRRCGVYEIRPMICRIWGLTRSMRCHYGCRPERWLSDEEAVRLLAETDLIGGEPKGRERQIRQALKNEAQMREAAAYIARYSSPATLEGIAASMPKRIIDR